MNPKTKTIALGGMLTAVCVVIMCLGTIVPVNTYVCPVLCILAVKILVSRGGKKMGLCCYAAVAVLGLMLAPDKEAAVVFLFLGYYPVLKPLLDRIRPKLLCIVVKLGLFSLAAVGVYGVMALVLGLPVEETVGLTGWLLVLFLILWDWVFLMVDWILSRKFVLRRKK